MECDLCFTPAVFSDMGGSFHNRVVTRYMGSGIRINKFLRDQGSNFSMFFGSGIKISAKNTGSVVKKYTSLRPCHNDDRNSCCVVILV